MELGLDTTERRSMSNLLRAGGIVLSVWAGFNLLLAAFVVVMVTLFKAHPLISRVVFTNAELAALSVKSTSTIKDLAILFNSAVIGFTGLVLIVTWTSLVGGQRWAFWALLGTIAFVQTMTFVGDAFIGNKTLLASVVTSILAITGIVLSWHGLRR